MSEEQPVNNAAEESNPSQSLSELTKLLLQEKEKNNHLESRLNETESSLKQITEHILSHKEPEQVEPELRDVKEILEDLDNNKLNNTLPNVQLVQDLIDLDTHVRTASENENSIFYSSDSSNRETEVGDRVREYFINKLEESKGDNKKFEALCQSDQFK